MPEYVTVSVNEDFLQRKNFEAHELGCVHIKRASKNIASWIIEVKIISNLS